MKLKSNTSVFEDFVKDQLNSYEAPYDESAWVKLEKDLPKQMPSKITSKSTLIKVAAISTLVITTATILFLNLNKKEQIVVENNTIITNTISQPENNSTVEQKTIATENKSITNTVNNNQKQTNINQNNTTENTINNKESDNKAIVSDNKITIDKNYTKPNIQKLPSSEFTYSASEGCGNLLVKFSPKEKTDSIIYLWNFGDGKTSNEQSPSHNFSKLGNYTVSLTTKYFKTDQITTIVKEKAITINPIPKADFSFDNEENEYTFRTLSSGSTNNKWIFEKDEISLEENPIHAFNKSGTYEIQLVSTNNYGCSATITKKITINIQHNYFVPNAFSPNGDGNNDTFGAVGKELENYNFEMLIYNKSGQLVFFSKNIEDQWTGINKENHQICEPGIYVWKIITKDKFNNIQNKTGNVSLQR